MKLSIPTIGLVEENDATVYSLMIKYRFQGLKIAPTRIFPERSYDMNSGEEARSNQLNRDYGFCVPS